MSPHGKRTIGPAKKVKAIVVALLCGTALIGAVPAVASAAAGAPGSEGGMNLEFARDTVRTVGPGALVFVKCTGPETGLCAGTVTLTIAGAKHKVPFSVNGGASQNLVVPLGSEKVGSGATALGQASTAQPVGAFAQSTEVLHFK
jgi:hypothetical protein